jgi:hypothetical protein
MRFSTRFWLPLALLGCLAGCEKEQPETSAAPVASVDKAAAIDPALAKAVAAASAAGARAAPTGSGQPPPNGIFPPGAADREMPKGAAPKLTLGSAGSEPRVKLGPSLPKPGFKTTGTFDIAVQADARQGALPVTVAVTIDASKPKSEGGAGAGGGEPVGMTVKVVGAKLGVTGVPAELAARFAKIKGSKVDYQIAPTGAGSGFRVELSPGAEETRDHMRVLSDILALVTLPMPAEPVGVGAMWMVGTRDGVFGLDLVTYRLVKVEAVTDDSATLSVSARRYATSNRFDFEGLPADAPRDLAEFECKSEGKLVYKLGAPLPASGDFDSVLGAQLSMPNQQRGVVQISSRVGLDLGKTAGH